MNSAIANWSTKPEVSSVSPFCRATDSTSRSGTSQPAEPKPRRQRLARRTHVDHMFGITAVQRTRPGCGRSGTPRRNRLR